MNQISIVLNDRSYEYDVYTLVIAFYQGIPTRVFDPDQEIPKECDLLIRVEIGQERVAFWVGEKSRTKPVTDPSRGGVKNVVKRTLYEMLKEHSGRDLPWGSLTGIRPVKLAMELLTEEKGDAKRAGERFSEAYFAGEKKAQLAVEIAQREKQILDSLHPEQGYSLYIGIPFCPSICLYCSFSSSPLHVWEKQVDAYLDALEKEMRACCDLFARKQLQTVYIGGGTPTTLSPQQSERLLNLVEEHFDLSAVREFTVEAGRPDSITKEKLQVLKAHGISRISINPQTMNQSTLDLIGRRHTVDQTKAAFALARELGFDNINMDLIVGLPGEGLAQVDHTMQEVEALDPDDITVHALALKRAARLSLHMDEYEAISFKASDEIMERCERTCRRIGMDPYYLYRQKNMAGNFENVGYAKAGREGLYNILIMEEVQSILALGASGSTKLVHENGRIERIENVKDIRNYLERIDEMIARKRAVADLL